MEIVFFLETLTSKWFKKNTNTLSVSLVEFECDGKGPRDSRKRLDGKSNLGFVWDKTSFTGEC